MFVCDGSLSCTATFERAVGLLVSFGKQFDDSWDRVKNSFRIVGPTYHVENLFVDSGPRTV